MKHGSKLLFSQFYKFTIFTKSEVTCVFVYLGVNVHVLLQTHSVPKGFPADAATKWSHSAV